MSTNVRFTLAEYDRMIEQMVFDPTRNQRMELIFGEVREQSYRTGRPQPSDVLLIIEVSDTSLRYDRGEKAMLYASAGVADYWIVNVQKRCVEVFRDPFDGEYGEKRTFSCGETIHPLALPNVALDVDRLF